MRWLHPVRQCVGAHIIEGQGELGLVTELEDLFHSSSRQRLEASVICLSEAQRLHHGQRIARNSRGREGGLARAYARLACFERSGPEDAIRTQSAWRIERASAGRR